jgi:hypothetical protein
MNNFRKTFYASLLIALISSAAQAQATRTWVSGVGDDVNPCSRTAPCKTFAGAISKTASGGEIDALDPGGFGTVTITKAITIDGTGTMASILASGTTGVTIKIDAKDPAPVRLRGLSINGAGSGINGINVLSAGLISVEDCVINGFTANGIKVAAGIVFVKNTTISNNVTAGITIAAAPAAPSTTAAYVALADVALIYNGVALVGAPSVQSLGTVYMYGNKTGDAKPVR